MDDWQAQRLLSRNTLRQIMQERLDEEMLDSDAAAMAGQEDDMPQFYLHNAIASNEAWHIKRVANQDNRVAELQKYVSRVVQYSTYCILGQHSDRVLAKIKDASSQNCFADTTIDSKS